MRQGLPLGRRQNETADRAHSAVTISIGHIEVTAAPPRETTRPVERLAQRPPAFRPRVSLGEFLDSREKRRR
jgi:hypothetical protein